jgi:hypothetical protein
VVALCKSHAPSTVLVEDTYGTSVGTLAEVRRPSTALLHVQAVLAHGLNAQR